MNGGEQKTRRWSSRPIEGAVKGGRRSGIGSVAQLFQGRFGAWVALIGAFAQDAQVGFDADAAAGGQVESPGIVDIDTGFAHVLAMEIGAGGDGHVVLAALGIGDDRFAGHLALGERGSGSSDEQRKAEAGNDKAHGRLRTMIGGRRLVSRRPS